MKKSPKTALFSAKQVDAQIMAQLNMALKPVNRSLRNLSPLQKEIGEKIDAQVEKALRPAEVSITVTRFKNIFTANGSLTKRSTPAKMEMQMKDHPRVRIDPNHPKTLKIRPKGATIRFTIKPRNQYYPIGITFKLKRGVRRPGDRARIGLLNFQTSQMPRDMDTLLITDSFKDEQRDDHYKFSVIIQRMKDGAIGIIDPDIIHEH